MTMVVCINSSSCALQKIWVICLFDSRFRLTKATVEVRVETDNSLLQLTQAQKSKVKDQDLRWIQRPGLVPG